MPRSEELDQWQKRWKTEDRRVWQAIRRAANDDELFVALQDLGEVRDEHSADETAYTSQELIDLIRQYRQTETDIYAIPKIGGLRERVLALTPTKH